MKLQDLSEERDNTGCEYDWEDLDYGDVCEFGDVETTFMGMKVDFGGEDIVVDLENNRAYPDVENYVIVKIFNHVELVYDGEDFLD